VLRIVPAFEIAVGDVEIAGAGVVREDAQVHVFKAALLNCQAFEPAMNWVPAQIPITVFRMVTPSK
jgi:hypothetical protein